MSFFNIANAYTTKSQFVTWNISVGMIEVEALALAKLCVDTPKVLGEITASAAGDLVYRLGI